MPKCVYCSQNYEFPKGLTLVESISGRVKYFCSSKCRKNALMARKKRKWAMPEKKK